MLVLFFALLVIFSCTSEQPNNSTFWQDGYCLQTNVMPVEADLDSIAVNTLEKGWGFLEIVDFPQSFVDWNKNRRLGFLNDIKGGRPELAGPHNGVVATCGY